MRTTKDAQIIEEDVENENGEEDGKGEAPRYKRPRIVEDLRYNFNTSIENIMPTTEKIKQEQ